MFMKLQEIIAEDAKLDKPEFDGFFELLPESSGMCELSCFKTSLDELAKKYTVCQCILDKSRKRNGRFRFYFPDIARLWGRSIVDLQREIQMYPPTTTPTHNQNQDQVGRVDTNQGTRPSLQLPLQDYPHRVTRAKSHRQTDRCHAVAGQGRYSQG